MSISQEDKHFVDLAYAEAEKSAILQEVPVGVVIVKDGVVIASAHNTREKTKDVTSHAEINALKKAAEVLGDWRLTDCTLYSSLEPCPMCAGAILHSRIDRLVYMALDHRWGACGSVVDLVSEKLFNHQIERSYYPDQRCEEILSSFFKELRKRKKK